MNIDIEQLRQAISDPGAFLPRGDNFQEPITSWSARAVALLLAKHDSETHREKASVTRQRNSMNFRDCSQVNAIRAAR